MWNAARAGGVLALCSTLFACSTYSEKPLPDTVAIRSASSLSVDTRTIALPALATQSIDLSAPFPMQAVAALAVLNSPALRAARDRAGVARAEAFAAGLLPMPRFSAKRELPRGNPQGATSSAYNIGLSLQLRGFLTHGASVDAVRAHVRQVNLDILWQEWQTALAAELDYISLVGSRQRGQLLLAEQGAIEKRLARDRAAADAGTEPRLSAESDLVELSALQRKVAQNSRQYAARTDALDTLLGLPAGTPLRLAGLPPLDPEAVRLAESALHRLPEIRPDLMALRAGYESEEDTLRKAVLSQFPSVGVSLFRARDTSDVHTLGFGIDFSLPILNGSPGRIAVASATRKTLFDTYRLRLRQAHADVARIMTELGILRTEQSQLKRALPDLQNEADAAQAALKAGDMTLRQAQTQQLAVLSQRLSLLDNAQQIADRAAALQLLTGSGIYAVPGSRAATRRDGNATAEKE